MKQLAIFASVFMLTIGLVQCKKEPHTNQNAEVETVRITVKVESNGSKAGVDPSNGKITFNNQDILYVGYNNAYVGVLSFSSSTNSFSGSLNLTTSGAQPLHFYYLGGSYATKVDATHYTIDITNQKTNASGYYPVISYGTSTTDYSSGTTTYATTLLNKCALVKFNVSSSSTSATRIVGMNNLVMVNFAENTLSYSQKGNGAITLSAGNGEKWAILLPQEALEAGEVGSAFSDDGWYKGTRGAIPAIENNDYLTNGISVEINTEVEIPEGALHGMFSINSDGDKVFFSKGNLQYIGSASTPYWKFADNQWTYLGNHGQGSTATNVDRDLFGWGTSGYNHGAVCYQPWCTSQTNSEYYVYGQPTNNLYDQTGMADWGVNPISNGGNSPNQWRTLTKEEWYYVLNSRRTASGIRWAKARVNYVHGIIIVPDDWNTSYGSLSSPNNSNLYYENNSMSAEYWESNFEPHGAVFLPAAGNRVGTSVSGISSGSYLGLGWYWSASYSDSDKAHLLIFGNSTLGAQVDNRYCGFSVRLAQDVD